jgi:hypothetical protein
VQYDQVAPVCAGTVSPTAATRTSVMAHIGGARPTAKGPRGASLVLTGAGPGGEKLHRPALLWWQ